MPEPEPHEKGKSIAQYVEEGEMAMVPGITIGKYRLKENIQKGGFATAWLAEDTLLDRKVVVTLPQVVAREGETDEKNRKYGEQIASRLRQQAKLMAKLRHPNIVTLLDAGEFNGAPFLVMDYIEGQTLQKLSEQDGAVSLAVLLRVMATVAGALQHAHDVGILHKDIKPGSIIVSTDGQPVLWNFPIAAPISGDPLLVDGSAVGTLGYMAPEQFTSPESMSYPVDIFSCGATMYTVLCGQKPLCGDGVSDVSEIVKRVVAPDPVDLSPLEGTPEFVIDVIRLCLMKNPDERYQTADELKRALEAALDYLESAQGETQQVALPRDGQTLLLNVEYQEAEMSGSFRSYQIGERISGGSFGNVYKAVELNSGTPVAIKILKTEHVGNERSMARFRREAMILTRLSHPNIVRVHNFGPFGPSFFMAMDLLGDRTLEDVIRERAPMDPREAVSLIAPALAGLTAMHQAGIVHRDLKPENIAVDGDRVVVFDFNCAHSRDMKRLTLSGVVLGTPLYYSPEQADAKEVGGATDIYAAGVTLYQMLTARLPHESDSLIELITMIASAPPVPVTDRRDDLPPKLVKALDWMLARDPTARPIAGEARRLVVEAVAG